MNQILKDEDKEEVRFVMSDIEPNTEAWKGWCKKSESGNLSYVSAPVDATGAPRKEVLLGEVKKVKNGYSKISTKKVMRLFSLAFHHFDDDMAVKVLKDTIETSDGFW